MAKLVFGMNQSLDSYVDHMAFNHCGRKLTRDEFTGGTAGARHGPAFC